MKIYLYFSYVFWMLLTISAAIPQRSRNILMASRLRQLNPLLNKATCCRSSPVGIGLINKQLPIGIQGVVNQSPVGIQGFNNQLPVGFQAIGNPNQLPLVNQRYGNQMPVSIQGIGNPNQLPFGVQGFGNQNQLPNGIQGIDYQSRSVGIAGINYQTPIGGEIGTQLPLGVGQIGNQIPADAGEINTQLIASISQLQAGIKEITNQLPVGVGGYPAQPEIGMNGFQPPVMRRLANEKQTESEKTIQLLREVINLNKEKKSTIFSENKDVALQDEPVQEIGSKTENEKAYECSLLKCSPDELQGPVCACNYNTGNTVSFKNECDVKKHNCRFRTGFKTILKEVCPWQFESRTGAEEEPEAFNYEDPRYHN